MNPIARSDRDSPGRAPELRGSRIARGPEQFGRRRLRYALLLFACVYLAYVFSPVSIQGDSRWTIPTALSFLHGQGGDLHDYLSPIVASRFYSIECVNADYTRRFPFRSLDLCPAGRLYNFHPVAVPLIALPFVAGLEVSTRIAGKRLDPLLRRIRSPRLRAFLSGDLADSSGIVENLISAFFAASAVAIFFLAALEFLAPPSALALALLFAFGTSMWSLVSRALWQHSPSVFFNALLILLLIRDSSRRRTLLLIGFALAFAFFIRPSNAVVVLTAGLYLSWRHRQHVKWVVAGGLPVTLGFVALNFHMYGHVLAPFFLPIREGSTGLTMSAAVPQAMAANLISPGRGLLLFTPFLLILLIPSVWREPMPPGFLRLRPWFCALIALYMILVAMHDDWWGGYSYGPRYLSDVLPFLVFLFAPVLPWMNRAPWRRVLTMSTVIVAVLIHFRGATSLQPHQWNATPISVNDRTVRIWDWTDPPFLRGLH